MTGAPWENDPVTQSDSPWENDPEVGPVEDVMRSIPSDIKAAASGFAGWPGDLRQAMHNLGRYLEVNRTPEGEDLLSQADTALGQKFGLAPGTKLLNPLTSEDVTSGLDTLTGGPSYQPQTTLGKDVQTGASLAGSLIGGPESLGTKVATRMVAPVAASEAGGLAGQYLGGDTGEQIGRIAGLMAGGPLAGGLAAVRSEKTASSLIPTTTEAHDQAQAAFQAAGLHNVQLNPEGYTGWLGNLYQKLRVSGFNPAKPAMGDVKAVISDIAKSGNRPDLIPGLDVGEGKAPLTMENIVQLRQQASDLFKNTGPDREAVHRMAHIITDNLDDYVHRLKGSDVISGDAQQAQAMVENARNLWARYKKAQTLDNIIAAAEGTAQASYTQAGFQTAVRRGVNNLLKKIQEKKSVGWTAPEVEALKAARNPGGLGTMLRAASVFSPRGWGGMMASGVLGSSLGAGPLITSGIGHVLGPLLAAHVHPLAALAGLGEVGRGAGNALARSAIGHAKAMVLSGGNAPMMPQILSPGGALFALNAANRLANQPTQ